MTVFEELKARGLIAQMTHEEKIKKLLEGKPTTFYVGFDATADSLHVGHFLQLVVMKHLQLAGHKPIALLGTGTTLIGDPTDRTDMRRMLDEETIEENSEKFRNQISKMIDFSDNKALFVCNGDWLKELNYIQFLRKIGRYFSVNKMLTAKSVKTRLERGLSFLEFNYMLMQSYDFLQLYQNYNCKLQMGGDDQWSNILEGIDLIRRVAGEEAYGMTFTLLTNKDGQKMGKTQNGAIWLDPDKCSPYDFYQYWRNVDDADVLRLMRMLTFIPLEEIKELESLEGNELNYAKTMLAYEVTKMVHGENAARDAKNAATNLFSKNKDGINMPASMVIVDNPDGINILELLVFCEIAKSKGDARRLIQQGGISIDGEKLSDPGLMIKYDTYPQGSFLVKKGKKVFHKIILQK